MKSKEIFLGSREAIEKELREDEEMLRELGAFKEDGDTKSLTDAEIEAQADDLGPEDLADAIARRTPEMQAFLNAKPESE